MRFLAFLPGLLAFLLIATPVAAHHKPGHEGGPPNGSSGRGGGPPGWNPGQQGGPPWGGGQHGGPPWGGGQQGGPTTFGGFGPGGQGGPFGGPGNSGAVQWCREHYADDIGDPFPFKNFGQCVAFFARGIIDDDDDDDDRGRRGELVVDDIDVDDNGRFRLQGHGAERRVVVSAARDDGVVAFGTAEPRGDGSFEIDGEWGCQGSDDEEDVDLLITDGDERVIKSARFPCDELYD